MVVLLLSSIHPRSAALSPSAPSPRSATSFFAILSPLFDSGDEQAASPATPSGPLSPALPGLAPPPLRFRRAGRPQPPASPLSPLSPRNKPLPPSPGPPPPSWSSAFSPSPLRTAYAALPSSLPPRPAPVPHVHVSQPEARPARRRPAPLNTALLGPSSARAFFRPASAASSAGLPRLELPDQFPSPASSAGPCTPRTPAPEGWADAADVESMLVPLAIEVPAADRYFVLPPLEAAKETGLRRPGAVGTALVY